MAKHSEVFKRDVVLTLKKLKREGIIRMKDKDNTEIKNIRQLCLFFDISTQSLYRWQKEISFQESEMNDTSDDIIPLRVVCIKESWCKAYQSKYDKGYGNCDMLGNCDDFVEYDGIDEHESESDLMKLHLGESEFPEGDDFDDIHYEKETRKASKSKNDFFVPGDDKKIIQDKKEKVIFNQRYYGWFAGMLGIKNYSNMLVPQLKVAIGNELIRQSGLVDMKKARRKLKKNGDNL